MRSYVVGEAEDYTVIILPPAVAPRTGFIADLPAACNGLVQFRDTSQYTPAGWQWSFGDGGTATQQHPMHQYAATGSYTVSLQARNAYGSQTVTKTSYVTVGALTAGPRPAACLPVPTFGATIAQHGFDTLKIGTSFFYHQPWNSPGYRDETCTRAALTLTQGVSYPLRFADSNFVGAACFAWLDANDNGIFESPGELVFNSLVAQPQPYGSMGTLTVPAAALTGRPLRFRVSSFAHDDAIPLTGVPSPCSRAVEVGQVRDFAVQVMANPLSVGAAAPLSVGRWQAAPNPSAGRITVFGHFAQPTKAELWDAVGRCVYQATVLPNAQANLSLNFGELPRGMYLLRLSGWKQSARLLLE